MANRTVYQIIAKAVGFKDSERAAKGLKESLGGLKTAAMGVAGAYFGSQALIAGIKASVQAFGEQELAEKKLEQALGRTSQALLNQASALQNVSIFGDEAIIAQQAFLAELDFTEQQIKDILPVAADLAAATGMTLESAVRNTAKTFSGLAGELGELVPQLRSLTSEQMMAGEAVEVMAGLFGGAAQAETKTFTGQVAQLENALGDIGETIGGLLVDNGVLSGLVSWAKEADEAFSFFFGTVKSDTSTDEFTEKINNQKEAIEARTNRIKENNALLLDEQFISEQMSARGKTEQEVRQSIIDTTIRYTEALKEEKEVLVELEEEQKKIPIMNIASTQSLDDYMKTLLKAGKIEKQSVEDQQKFAKAKKQLNADMTAIGVGAIKDLGEAVGADAKTMEALTIAQALADTYAGANKAFAQGGTLGYITGAAIIASGLANVRSINQAYKKKEGAQYGFEGVVDEPTQFTVGEGGQAEFVSVTPMEGVDNSGVGTGVTVNIQGNVMTDEFVDEILAEKIADAVRRGTDFGMS